ncbi:helix-turn-helix domain-containing protein [Falsigemmobacter faecalis]|uniref:Helix-turn-helix domain-containing protein n=1 Tax=Falsigemmobacter faecalis TaxID=2488730 RepID=A0A3P3D885_9RHOB|nr:hypothetical protein [Falsigemmobacter faecalis]RRH70024.1 hypothetical protein EG244_17595 [Falsigemmobacter faecalis]
MSLSITSSIAARIISKCGGHKATAELAGVSLPYVYRWTYPRERGGLNGRVPELARRALLGAAKAGRVNLTPLDFEEGWADHD